MYILNTLHNETTHVHELT